MCWAFEDAMVAARDAGATVQFDAATNNPHFAYREGDGTRHDVWFLDAVTAFNQIHAADPYRPAGYALVAAGLRRSHHPAPDGPALQSRRRRTACKHIANNIEDVDFDGEGEILRVEADPRWARAA